MIDRLGVHRADHRDVIRDGLHVRQQLAHLNARLTTALKGKFARCHGEPLLPAGHRGDALAVADGVRQVLVKMIRQARLVIEEIDLRRSPVHVQVNQPLGLGRKVRQAGQRRMHVTRRGVLRPEHSLAEHGSQRNAAHLETGTLEKLPPVL